MKLETLVFLALCLSASGVVFKNTTLKNVTTSSASSQDDDDGLIPEDRLADWIPEITVGVPGGIPVRDNLIDVTESPYFADFTGVTNASAAIQAAIDAASAEDVVYCPAGTYKLTNALNMLLKHNITLRGDGTNTIFRLVGDIGFTSVGGTYQGLGYPYFVGPISGAVKGATNVTFDTNPYLDSSYVGRIVEAKTLNDSYVFSVSGYEYMQRQKVRVTAISATNMTFWPPLTWTLNTNLNAVIGTEASSPGRFIGLEDCVVDATNSQAVFVTGIIAGYGCWVKNVTVLDAANYPFAIGESVQCEMRGCNAYRAKHDNPGDYSNHAGLLFGASTGCLVEDNIFYQQLPGIEMNAGCAGNVIAYNFFWDANVLGVAMSPAIDSNHGAHNHHNLFEGNVGGKLQSDGYFGSESDATIYRNWWHTTSPGLSSPASFGLVAVDLKRFSWRFSVVGNILGSNGLAMYYDNRYGSADVEDLNGTGTQQFAYNFGLPNIGNGGFDTPKLGPPWAQATHAGFGTQIGTTVTAVSNVFNEAEIYGAVNYLGELLWSVVYVDDNYTTKLVHWTNATTVSVENSLNRTNVSFRIGPGPNGYQELDTNVLVTAILRGNYNYASNAIPPVESLGTNILADSLFRTNKPSYFGSLTWPPFDPTSPGTPSFTNIPAGYRYVYGTNPPAAP